MKPSHGYDPAALPRIAELPDPLLRADGSRIEEATSWSVRRQELLEVVLNVEYGLLPPDPDGVELEVIASRRLPDTEAFERELLLRTGPGNQVQTPLWLTVPPGTGPFPVIVRGDLCWGRVDTGIVSDLVRRGYALAEFDRTRIASDSPACDGVYEAYPGYAGGRLAAWAWGYSRVVDSLSTLSEIDPGRVVVTGHSRGGKAALLAGAVDTRIALTAPNNSGCGGAGCFRLQAEGSEDIAAILKNFPYWFHPEFGAFIGQIDRLPFDQHTVRALVAPRALLSTEALDDLWANPKGSQQSYLAAWEVFRFLGAEDRIGIVFRPGGHEHNQEDWNALMDFADVQLFHKPAARRFDTTAPE